MEVTKNVCFEHAILFNILPIDFKFSDRKTSVNFYSKQKALKSNQLAFQTFFRINKIIKIDGATSILNGYYGVKLTIFLIYK